MLPTQVINNYVQLNTPLLQSSGGIKPFFPVHDSTGVDASWKNLPYVVYDWIKLRTNTDLYVRKTEQLVYSVRGTIDNVYTIRDSIIQLLDKQNLAAIELNDWQRQQDITDCVSFHTILAWQAGRVVQPQSITQYYTLPMIIEYILAES